MVSVLRKILKRFLILDLYHWTKVIQKGEIPAPRSGCKMVTYEKKIYLFGGCMRKNGDYLNDLFILNTVDYIWFSYICVFIKESIF